MLGGDLNSDLELIYFHVNRWSHPEMRTLGREEPNNLRLAMWASCPQRKNWKTTRGISRTRRPLLNAKSKNLFDHFMYHYCWENQRCIPSVDGFFEPLNTQVKVKGKDFKVPFYFHRKNGDPIYLAGIYTNTVDGRRTIAVLTKDATPMFAEIYNEKKRPPVIIDEENLDSWLY